MERIIRTNYFNYCAFVLLIILMFSIFFRRMTHGKLNKYYIVLVLTSIFSTVFDIFSIHFNNIEDFKYTTLHYITQTGYLLCHNITTPIYIMYIICLTDTGHKVKKNKLLVSLIAIPISVVLLAIFINPFINILFTCEGGYQRGKLFPLVYICGIIYVIIGMYVIIANKNLFSSERFTALVSVFPMVLIAVIIQLIFPMYPVEMFFFAIALLFISMMIQRPEETIDTVTGVNKFSSYGNDMKRTFKNEKSVDIILINISNYATLQEILGYDGKNEMLKEVAFKLMKINKQLKLFADLYYLDRGRFRVVLYDKHMSMTEEAADKINEMLKEQLCLNDMTLNLMSFVCVAHCPEDISDFKTLMAFGNDFHEIHNYTGDVLYAKSLIEKKSYNIMKEIDKIIESAIVNNKFSVYYQPIYSVDSKKFNSAEALLRLIDDNYGFIPPDIFIPAAEKSGAIHKIGAFVLEDVCRFISSDKFKECGLDYVEINLSVIQCMQKNLAADVVRILQKYNVSPDKINLEITETAASNSQHIMSENLSILSEYGISFSLDDFGTGYSNMRRMASLPLKIVKLDKTFANFNDNPKLFIVLQNTIKMLKAMEMEIVVEGIETEELVKKFSEMKCEYIQGYYYSKPLPEKDFIEFMIKSLK